MSLDLVALSKYGASYLAAIEIFLILSIFWFGIYGLLEVTFCIVVKTKLISSFSSAVVSFIIDIAP